MDAAAHLLYLDVLKGLPSRKAAAMSDQSHLECFPAFLETLITLWMLLEHVMGQRFEGKEGWGSIRSTLCTISRPRKPDAERSMCRYSNIGREACAEWDLLIPDKRVHHMDGRTDGGTLGLGHLDGDISIQSVHIDGHQKKSSTQVTEGGTCHSISESLLYFPCPRL